MFKAIEEGETEIQIDSKDFYDACILVIKHRLYLNIMSDEQISNFFYSLVGKNNPFPSYDKINDDIRKMATSLAIATKDKKIVLNITGPEEVKYNKDNILWNVKWRY